MKLYLFFLSVLSSLILIGCGRQDKSSGEAVTIPFNRAERLSYGSLPENFFGRLDYVTLRPEGQDYLFAEADKVVYQNGQLYIMDWISRKIVSFKEDGEPGTVLHKRGRGPGEYLQITDFDVDDNGSIYILDGQRDMLLRYSPGCMFEESWELPFQANFISGNGVDSVYHFDFGARAVPDEVRQDIEGHLDELDSYETLVKWVNIYGRFIAGSVRRDGRFDDFIFDRQQERVYMQDDTYRCISIAGLSQDAIIFRISDTGEGLPDFIPENIRRSIAGGEDVFAIAKF